MKKYDFFLYNNITATLKENFLGKFYVFHQKHLEAPHQFTVTHKKLSTSTAPSASSQASLTIQTLRILITSMTMSILNANTTNNHYEHLHVHHHQHHHLCVQPEIPDVVTREGLVRVSEIV